MMERGPSWTKLVLRWSTDKIASSIEVWRHLDEGGAKRSKITRLEPKMKFCGGMRKGRAVCRATCKTRVCTCLSPEPQHPHVVGHPFLSTFNALPPSHFSPLVPTTSISTPDDFPPFSVPINPPFFS